MLGSSIADGLVIAIDVGTSGLKACLFSSSGRCVARSKRDWRSLLQLGSDHDHSQLVFDPSTLWPIVVETVGEAMEMAAQGMNTVPRIAAVCTTSQRQGIVMLDQNGTDFLGIPNVDSRARHLAAILGDQLGERIYQVSGRWPGAVHPLCKLLWLKANYPDVFARIHKVLSLADWVAYKLTAQLATHPSLACETGLFDVARGRWSDELLGYADIRRDLFPDPVWSTQVVGYLAPAFSMIPSSLAAQARTNSIPVFIGGADTQCGVLGAGAHRELSIAVVAGTSAPVQQITGEPVLDPGYRTITNAFLIPDMWVLESNAMMTGLSWAWIHDLIKQLVVLLPGYDGSLSDNGLFQLMESAVSQASPGSNGIQSVLGTGIMDSRRGSISSMSGVLAPWSAISAGVVGPCELMRSVIEASGYAIRANVDQLEDVIGADSQQPELFIGGGSIRSSAWTRIVADIIGRRVAVAQDPDITALGSAMCSFVALGACDSLAQAARTMCRSESLTADPAMHRRYDKPFEAWKSTLRDVRALACSQ